MKKFMQNVLTFETDQLKIIHSYRYLSWFFTSIFYLIESSSLLLFKFGVIILLLISAVTAIGAYNSCNNKKVLLKFLITLETLGIVLVILPTGGLVSPFIWYALNPVLISASFSLYIFCWLDLIFYISSSTLISYLFYNSKHLGFKTIISQYSYLFLIFILITVAVQLLTRLTNKLKNQSDELKRTNTLLHKAQIRSEESMEQIMSLYQIAEAFTSQDDKNKIYQNFADYTARLTRTKLCFFWLKSDDKDHELLFLNSDATEFRNNYLVSKLTEVWQDNLLSDKEINFDLLQDHIMASTIRSASKNYGIIGIRPDKEEPEIISQEYRRQLDFVSNLAAEILERLHLEEVAGRMIVIEEQNRIANEMHDSVAQRLFSISYTVHAIMEEWEKMTIKQMHEKLELLQASSHEAMKELRSTIYRLSLKKNNYKSFRYDVKKYIDNLAALNNVDIQFDFHGDEELLNITQKKGIYRIISEATGNSIRHGNSSKIIIRLTIELDNIKLDIIDNGKGFEIRQMCHDSQGLGLENMNRLVLLLDGEMNINSNVGNGTMINIVLQNRLDNDNDKGEWQFEGNHR